MNLDDYSSKYIDGELDAAEDAEMRLYLSENDAARAEFENAALISVAMMREAEAIEVPEQLYTSTNTLVLDAMKLYAQEHEVLSGAQRGRRTQRRSLVALLCLFVAAQFSVRDGIWSSRNGVGTTLTPEHSISLAGNASNETGTIHVTANSSSHAHTGARHEDLHRKSRFLYTLADATAFTKVNAASPSEDDQPRSLNISQGSTSMNSSSNTGEIDVQQTRIALPQSIGLLGVQRPVSSVTNAALSQSLVPKASMSSKDDGSVALAAAIHPAEVVQVSTFLGTILKSTTTSSSAQHFSQSIGYRVSEQDAVGVEVGSFAVVTGMQQQYGMSGTSSTPSDGTGQHKGTLSGSEDPQIINNGLHDSQSSARLASVASMQSQNLLWGAAYFEHAFVRSSDLNLKARVAVGSTDGGPIVVARALSSLRVMGPVSLTLGTEGRMFFLDTKNVNGTDLSMQTMVSLVYGVQIKF